MGDAPAQTLKNCQVCGANDWAVERDGPVRGGAFGRTVPGVVYGCNRCGVQWLPPVASDLRAYYQSGAYRVDLGEGADIESFFTRHDAEQFGKYALLEHVPIRDKIVADIGCGGGSFLDGVRGFAAATVAIDPATAYHASLGARGHRVYSAIDDALPEWRGRVQVATCFCVIEHVEEPVAFLRAVRALLGEGGLVLVGTPNRRDMLLKMHVESYRRFFYRVAHTHYFDEPSLRRASAAAGFSSMEPKYVQRFGFANFVGWLQDGKPSGDGGHSALGASFDRLWKATLEEQGVADYLYAYLRP